MGESTATKVDVAPAVDSVTRSVEKGNRGAEEAIDEELPAKKQKVECEAENENKTHESAGSFDSDKEEELNLLAKKVETPAEPPVKESCSADDIASFDEDKNNVPSEELPIATVNDEPLVGSKKDDSRNDSESNDDHKNPDKVVSEPKELLATASNNGSVVATEEKNETSHNSEEESTPGVTLGGKPEEKQSIGSDDEPPKLQSINAPTQDLKNNSNIEEQTFEDDASEEEEDRTSMTPKKTDTDVRMVDAASTEQSGPTLEKEDPQTPGTSQVQAAGSKTLFIGNLSFAIEQTDVEDFFKDVGEIVSMRFSVDREGAFKGFGHVEFATVEAAQKAMQLNSQEILGRPVKLDFAREKSTYTPYSSNENSSTKVERVHGTKIYVRGFDTNDGEEKIRIALKEHFGSCGEISRVSIPRDYEGCLKGIAYIDFKDSDGFNKAMELGGSHLGENILIVEEARSRDRDGGGGRFGGGGSGRYWSSGGGYASRDSGGYGGRDGGGYGGRDGGYGGRDGSGGGYRSRDGGGWHSGRRRW